MYLKIRFWWFSVIFHLFIISCLWITCFSSIQLFHLAWFHNNKIFVKNNNYSVDYNNLVYVIFTFFVNTLKHSYYTYTIIQLKCVCLNIISTSCATGMILTVYFRHLLCKHNNGRPSLLLLCCLGISSKCNVVYCNDQCVRFSTNIFSITTLPNRRKRVYVIIIQYY